jgi:hypothetical protein
VPSIALRRIIRDPILDTPSDTVGWRRREAESGDEVLRNQIAAACLALALGGCVVAPAVPVAPDLNDPGQRAVAGAVAGAGAGALIGSLSGDAGTGALVGGAFGGLLGVLATPPKPAPYPAYGYDPRQGGWYDQYGRWHPGAASRGYDAGYP